MKAIIVSDHGHLRLGDVSDPPLAPKRIKIKVHAVGVNRADILQKKGQYPPPPGVSEVLGLEVAGKVVEKGKSCDTFDIGDKVFALLAGGGYAEYVTVLESHAMPIPDGLSYTDAAGIAEVFITSYQVLFDIAKLKNNESVLIHAGASGVGTAAIQLARSVDARVWVTAGSTEKITFCKGLGADYGINYRQDPDFYSQIRNETDSGIDIIIDCIGGPYTERNLKILNNDGRWIVLAMMGGRVANIDLAQLLMKRVSMTGSTLRARTDNYKTNLIYDFSNRFLPLFSTGELRPVIDSVYDWSDVEVAHKKMENNENIGKLILETA